MGHSTFRMILPHGRTAGIDAGRFVKRRGP
jgi:hypothetical protein